MHEESKIGKTFSTSNKPAHIFTNTDGNKVIPKMYIKKSTVARVLIVEVARYMTNYTKRHANLILPFNNDLITIERLS